MATQRRSRNYHKPAVPATGASYALGLASMAQNKPKGQVAGMAPWRHPSDAPIWETIEARIRAVYAWQRKR